MPTIKKEHVNSNFPLFSIIKVGFVVRLLRERVRKCNVRYTKPTNDPKIKSKIMFVNMVKILYYQVE